MQNQHKVGLSSSKDFGTSSSHVVCRGGYACSTSGFEAFSTALAAMGTSLELCLVCIHDVIRVLWSGPHCGASAHLLPLLCSGAFNPWCVFCVPASLSLPSLEEKQNFFFYPCARPTPPYQLLHSSLQCRDVRKGGCRESLAGGWG